MTVSAMYPGTFDPITLGHEDLVRRAASCSTRSLSRLLTTRVARRRCLLPKSALRWHAVLADIESVEVTGYSGLTVDFALKQGLRVMIRGLRAVSDFEYEFQLANMNRHLTDEVETAFLTPTEKYTFISSSLVREVASLGGDVSEFVSPKVQTALMERVGRDVSRYRWQFLQ